MNGPAPGHGATASPAARLQAAPVTPVAGAEPASVPVWRRWPGFVALMLVLGGGGGGAYWWLHRPAGLPPGITFSNGRLEADEIDIDTKFAGRIAEIMADEGDMVRTGQVVARIDTRDLAAQLAAAQAQTAQAQQAILQKQANLVAMGSQLRLAAQELQRARTLVVQGYETQQVLDQRQSTFNTATSSYHETEAQIASALAAAQTAAHNADLIQVNITDDTLVAPKDGPIEYRLTNVGEVLAAGGKVFTMLDVTYVYMDIFLATPVAGKVKLGDEARIVLDALPELVIPARVAFIAAQNEFTPKAVETKQESDKLMFRIRVRIDPALLRQHEAEVRSGLPGLTYIRIDAATAWPALLATRTGG